MKRYLLQHDLVYESALLEWEQGLPLANGDMGVLIWGDGAPLKFTLDKYDVWERRFPEFDPNFTFSNLRRLHAEKRWDEMRKIPDTFRTIQEVRTRGPYPTRLPLGRLELDWGVRAKDFKARLVLASAEAKGKILFPEGSVRWSTFVCSEKNILALELHTDKGAPKPVIAVRPPELNEEEKQLLKSWGYPEPESGTVGGIQYLSQKYGEGQAYTIAWVTNQIHRKTCAYLTIVTSNESRDNLTTALENLKETQRSGISRLRNFHTQYWTNFWSRSAVRLPDSRMENLWYVEMYKLGCASKSGRLPMPVQGPWPDDGKLPIGSGDYHIDMNVQEDYWPVYASNHLECGLPLYEMFSANLPFYKEMGKRFYDVDVPLIFCATGPGGEPIPGYAPTNLSPGNAAWLAHLFWLHWRYSQDVDFLRQKAYPFLKECCRTYLCIIEKRSDGKFHIPFTESPEYFEGKMDAWDDDTTYDIFLLQFLLRALLEAEEVLGEKDPDHQRWIEVEKDLVSPPQRKEGKEKEALMLGKGALMLSANQGLDHSHRHHSHLIGIYPLGLLAPGHSEEEDRVIQASTAELVRRGTGEWMGFSFPWASLIAGRTGKTWQAYHLIRTYLDNFIAENTFHLNAALKQKGISCWDYEIELNCKMMTMDAGLAYATAVMEMLIQSQGGLLRIFPTTPPIWRDTRFENLRAEGAFLVSAERRNTQTVWAEIKSERGGLCRVLNPFGDDNEVTLISLTQKKKGIVRQVRGKIIDFKTKTGGVYLLARTGTEKKVLANRKNIFSLAPRKGMQANWFGVKKVPRF